MSEHNYRQAICVLPTWRDQVDNAFLLVLYWQLISWKDILQLRQDHVRYTNENAHVPRFDQDVAHCTPYVWSKLLLKGIETCREKLAPY